MKRMLSFKKLMGQRRPKVLVVIEDDGNRIAVSGLLSSAGMEVRAEKAGNAGLATLGGFAADVALVDRLTPVMDGESFRRAVRADPATRELPVLLLESRLAAGEDLLARVRAAIKPA